MVNNKQTSVDHVSYENANDNAESQINIEQNHVHARQT